MKIHNLAILLLVSFLSVSLHASTNPPVAPGRPSTPRPITDQELIKLTAFFRVQTPEKTIDSIKMQKILGETYAHQATTVSKFTNHYEILLNAVTGTKNFLINPSKSINDKKLAIYNLERLITQLYNSI